MQRLLFPGRPFAGPPYRASSVIKRIRMRVSSDEASSVVRTQPFQVLHLYVAVTLVGPPARHVLQSHRSPGKPVQVIHTALPDEVRSTRIRRSSVGTQEISVAWLYGQN